MKTTTIITTGLLYAFAMSTQAATVISYSEYFTHPDSPNVINGDDRSLSSTVGWNANYGSTATAHNVTSSDTAIAPVLSWVSFLFNGSTNPSANTSSFIWVDGLSAGLASEFDSVRFSLNNSNGTTENIKIALQIGGSWYVTNNNYNGTNIANILSTAGSTWNFLDFTSEDEMGIGSAATFPVAGTITGVGIYDEVHLNSVRFDNLEIHTVPEPSAFILLGAGTGLALLRRRR